MIAVIFEVEPAEGQAEEYFTLARSLAPTLEQIDGFISVERFESRSQPGKFLSLSFWRDDHAVEEWRNLEAHRVAQASGRGGIFSGYRIRVAGVFRDYGLTDRTEAPTDSRARHG